MHCAIVGCNGKHHALGWCRIHYERWKRHGDPLSIKRLPCSGDVCAVAACDRVIERGGAHGWCKQHYKRWLKYGDPGQTPIGDRKPKGCKIDGCDRKHYGLGWCNIHYRRWTDHGDPEVVTKAPPGSCVICIHPDRLSIETEIIDGRFYSEIGQTAGVSAVVVHIHAFRHMGIRRDPGARCSVCNHPDIDAIDEMLEVRRKKLRPSGRVPYTSEWTYKALAVKFDLSAQSLVIHDKPAHQQRRARYQLSRLNALQDN